MPDRNLTEEQARELWERAARLQAESAARELTSGSQADEDDEPAVVSDSAYSVDVVRRSAVEAGISAEFVERALEELQPGGEPETKVDRWADRYLGEGPRVLRVRREIPESPEEVYAAMGRVLPNSPYGLTLTGIDGPDPTDGATLVFEVPYTMLNMDSSGRAAYAKAITDIRHWADIKELRFRLTPLHEEGQSVRTELEIFAYLAPSRRMNFWVGTSVSGGVALVAGLIGTLIAGRVIDPVTAAQFGSAIGAGSVSALGSFFGLNRAWRPIYRSGIGKGRAGMEKLIDAIQVDMHTGGAFSSRVEPRSLPPKSGGVKGMLDDLGL